MHRHPYEFEIDASYARGRVAETMAATRPMPQAATRPAGPPPVVAWMRRSIGRGLIAAGKRLAGPSAQHPAPAGPAV